MKSCMLNFWRCLMASFFFYCGCSSKHVAENDIPISNSGVRFEIQLDLPRVFVVGDYERRIMKMDTPPLEALLASLMNENKWKAAHVLLTMRYEKSTTNTAREWNGMHFQAPSNSYEEMSKVNRYWQSKLKQGELESSNSVFSEEALRWLFGIEESAQKRYAKIESFFKENPVDLQILSSNLLGDSNIATNPPPRGAAGSGGSEESDD